MNNKYIESFWEKVSKTQTCWLWTASKRGNDYGNFRRRYAHRVSWEMAFGQIPVGMFVCHKCDVKLCVNPAHMFLGTQLDNIRDAAKKGRLRNGIQHGELNSNARLTREQANTIREAYLALPRGQFRIARGALSALAKKFGISVTMVRFIGKGKNWRMPGI
jgi:hypothetical protein